MSDSRLRNYALAAGGSAALAAAGAASAEIQKSSGSTLITAGAGSSSIVDLFTIDNGVDPERRLRAGNRMTGTWSSSGSARVYLNFDGGGQVWNMVDAGASIGPGFTGTRSASQHMSFNNSAMFSSTVNNLASGTGKIVGFSLDVSETFYGWIDYDLSMSEGEYAFTVNSWAYNDVAYEGIIAGQYQAAGSSAVPGLGGLAALAIGAAGVRSRRQRTVA
ncbi:MAG: hypothetical protein CMJ54_02580 [Planctomycetaceae bacterium]|nr:hypothetical protein [Planctomycetaceae bacterium]